MNSFIIRNVLIAVLLAGSGLAMACEYQVGETRFTDYANCRYGEDRVLVIDLPEGSGWERCVYYSEAFRPEKLLAVTRLEDGREVASLNNRSQIGNPCYMSKQKCDRALKAHKSGGY